jgi:hypothetical protein
MPFVRDDPVADLAAPPVRHHHADDHRHREPEAEDRLSHEVRDLVERAPKQVADRAEERGPEAGADDAVRDEAPVREARRAGDERCQRPDEADEAPDQDRLAPVAIEVRLHLLQARLGDLETRAMSLEEPPSEPLADEEAGGVAKHRGQPDDPDQREQVDRALPGHDPGRHDDRLTGRHESHKCAGLEEGRHGDQRVCPRPERLSDVLDHLLRIGQRRQHPGRVDPQREHDHHAERATLETQLAPAPDDVRRHEHGGHSGDHLPGRH